MMRDAGFLYYGVGEAYAPIADTGNSARIQKGA